MDNYLEDLKTIDRWISQAEAIVIGGASGMSAACGFDYYNHGPFFQKHFSDFGEIYGESSCWQLLYHRYESHEERWAYMARSGCVMLDLPVGQTYKDLHRLAGGRNYYIITTNQDAQFAKIFDPERIFTVQGDAHWMQCANRCHDRIYPSEETLHRLNESIVDGQIPAELVPRCPVCGGVMEPWVKSFIFQYGSYWEEQAEKYRKFLRENRHRKILFLALGVGRMTPEFIKNPFLQMTAQLPNSRLALINRGEPKAPAEIADRTVAVDGDILDALHRMARMGEEAKAYA